MNGDVGRIRNLGISAHIDSGKTTLSERILFYTRRIRAMHEVKGKDGAGATLDYMDLERERGITITSAATSCTWRDHEIHLIDTPGHVDFTIEVERALRVLDGAILVLCAVGGVQSQSITVDRQMNRYRIPRIAFINKCDRRGANPARVVRQLRETLGLAAASLQIPIGLEGEFEGVIDLVRMEAVYFDGGEGQVVRREAIPEALREEAERGRRELLDAVTLCSDELTEAVLEGRATEEQIRAAIRRGVLERRLTPVLLGSAYRNKGIQPLLDAAVDFLPCPADVENTGLDLRNDGAPVSLRCDGDGPVAALAFKLEESRYGQITHVRVYRGRLVRGDTVLNARTGKKVRLGRLVRMHADHMEDIDASAPGDIVALFGIECASGDTFCDPAFPCAMTSMHVPEPVISLAVKAADEDSQTAMSKALGRFCREDPTFRSHVDPESGETIVRGMGELHLDVYLERMRREYGVRLTVGPPQVAYRETITAPAAFDHVHKKQTGGAGQYGRVIGVLEPLEGGEYEFIDETVGGTIPREFVPSCDKGFRACLKQGTWVGAPITGVRVRVTDGASHAVDSSDLAFQHAAIGAFRGAYARARPVVLEPVMKVVVETPSEHQGPVLATLSQRRGMIVGTQEDGTFSVVEAEVPLSEMFGYSTVLRSRSQGMAEFTMEFARYRAVPASVAEELRARWLERTRRGSAG